MLFNSYVFLFGLLPVILAGYALLPRRAKTGWLLVCSYLFYGWWDWRYCLLLLLVTCIDYRVGKQIGLLRQTGEGNDWKKRAKSWLGVSVACDLGLLSFFKYYDFGVGSLNAVSGWMGTGNVLPLLHLALPVGISFYIFQSMSFSIDIYRGEAEPAKRFLDFACYVSMFPQLVAGPIVRWREMDSQFRNPERNPGWGGAGIVLFVMGLAKKVLLADGIAPLADAAFGADAPGGGTAWVGLVAYTLQIYFDFSGYSDMAVGLGLMLGFRFPQNFDSPYKSSSMTEFWRRWHMSLSGWLRDYLYIPLGGNRKGTRRTYINLFLTMLLGGLWHGANWTFVLWGGYHGLWLALERMRGKRSCWNRLPAFCQRGATFVAVMGGWLLFRSGTMSDAARMLKGLLGGNGWNWAGGVPAEGSQLISWVMLAAGLVLVFGSRNSWEVSWRPGWRLGMGMGLLAACCLVAILVNSSSPFLYFQF